MKAGEFGYASIHYIVSFKRGIFPNIPEEFYQRHQLSGEKSSSLTGPKYKAEIQVRTLLQHAWAAFTHDRLYKNEFKIPRQMEREAARISALLEDADDSFSGLLNQMDMYKSNFGAYMSPEELSEEIAILEAIKIHDPQNESLAHQLAKLYMAQGNWSLATQKLADFTDSNNPAVLRDIGAAELEMNSAESCQLGKEHLEEAIQLDQNDPDNANAYCALAEKCLSNNPSQALLYYEKAFKLAPSGPRTLGGFLESKIVHEKSLDFLPLLYPSLDAAISKSWDRISVGVHLPWAYFDIGKFELLRNQPYESLLAYSKAIQFSDNPHPIKVAFQSIQNLQDAIGHLYPEIEWIRRFLLLALVKKVTKSIDAIQTLATPLHKEITPPVIIIAGGCDKDVSLLIKDYRDLLHQSLQDFQGTIISGGTTDGVSGLVGELQDAIKGEIQLLSYLPSKLPEGVEIHPNYKIYQLQSNNFSPLEPLQNWIDLITAEIPFSQIKVLGVNGGKISASEYRMALALGVDVGVFRDSGREANKLLLDGDWQGIKGLAMLPTDVYTVKAFLQTARPSLFEEDTREELANKFHEEYRKDQSKRFAKADPAMHDWENLSEELKNSNRLLVDHLGEKLKLIGYTIRKAANKNPIQLPHFTDAQIEEMSESEHGRWNAERLLNGWLVGDRDVEKKKSPYLVSWTELPENVKKWDRDIVKKIPLLLKEKGYEVVPLK